MTYAYTLMIIDENGDIKGGRELSAEQAIDLLLKTEPAQVVEAELEEEFEIVRAPAPKKRGGVKGPPLKVCCGSKGQRHKKGCSSESQSKGNLGKLALSGQDPLTEEQFDDLHDAMHDRDFTSRDYAESMDLTISEVNLALTCATYQGYLDAR